MEETDMAEKPINDIKEKYKEREERIRQFAESISVRDVPQRKGQSPYPRINRFADQENKPLYRSLFDNLY